MCDTGGTLIKSIEILTENGVKDVIVVVTHGILSGEAINKINDCKYITKMIVTNSVDQTHNLIISNKLDIIPIDNLMSQVINCLNTGESISQLFYS